MTRHMPTRRNVLTSGLALGCSAAASPFLTPVTLAAAPTDARFVVIVLRGAMDGLDVVQPYGDTAFHDHRRALGGGEAAGAEDLDGFYALHAGLSDLMPLWQSGEMAFAHAVSTPYRDKRSHFDGQDLLENGGASASGTLTEAGDGWLNRALSLMPGAEARTALAVGREQLLLLKGTHAHASWAPDGRLDVSADGRDLLHELYANDPLFHAASSAALELSGETPGMQGGRRQAARARALAGFAASQLKEDTRIAAFSLDGWDTHRNQKQGIGRALAELSSAILTLRRDLGPVWEKTAIIGLTEFGRTVRENGSGGTDHGTGGAAIMAGGALAGARVHGRWPGLGQGDLYEDRDLMPTDDVRRYAAWMMRDLLQLAPADLERVVFPGLDLMTNPQVIS